MPMTVRLFKPEDRPHRTRQRLTVARVVELYIETHNGLFTTRAHAERERTLRLFSKQYGDEYTRDCTPSDLEDFILSNKSWKADNTKRRHCATVHTCFNWAARGRRIRCNPFSGYNVPPGDCGQPMSDANFSALLRAARFSRGGTRKSGPRFRRAMVFLRWTGCRPCEMAALEWSFLDIERGCAVLRRHKTQRSRKDRAPRVIVLHPVVLRMLAWIRQHDYHERFVFQNAKGTSWQRSGIDKRVHRLRTRAGIPKDVKIYGLRHQFATQAIRKKVGIKTVAELLGHAGLDTVQRYVHIAGDIEHLAAGVIQAMQK